MAPETVYEIVEEDGLTFQYMYELVRDGEIESINPLYKKFIRKSLVGGGSGNGSGDKPIINSNEKGLGGEHIRARGCGSGGGTYYKSYNEKNATPPQLTNGKIGEIVTI